MAVLTTPKIGVFKNEPLLDYSDPQQQERIRAALAEVRRGLGATYPLIVGPKEVTHAKTFAILRETRMPAVQLETATITNPDEELLLGDPVFQRRAAEAIAAGLRRFARQPLP